MDVCKQCNGCLKLFILNKVKHLFNLLHRPPLSWKTCFISKASVATAREMSTKAARYLSIFCLLGTADETDAPLKRVILYIANQVCIK